MEGDSRDQLLGILVAEKAHDKGIPFVMTTSKYRHDVLGEPLVIYVSARGWHNVVCGSIDDSDKKKESHFWREAYELLMDRMEEAE